MQNIVQALHRQAWPGPAGNPQLDIENGIKKGLNQ